MDCKEKPGNSKSLWKAVNLATDPHTKIIE